MGSNLLIRDGGIDGLIIKLGKNFSGIDIESDLKIVKQGKTETFLIKKTNAGTTND